MDGMVGQVVALLLSAGVGFATGFFFERRATQRAELRKAEAEAHSKALMAEVDHLTDLVISLGGDPEVPPEVTGPLEDLVLERMRGTQDSRGRVARGVLIGYFVQHGRRPGDVETAVVELVRRGQARDEGRWIHVL